MGAQGKNGARHRQEPYKNRDYGPRTGRSGNGRDRRRRRRNRVIKAVIAWAICVLLIGLVAVGTIRIVGSLASSKKRQHRADGIEKLEAGDFGGAITSFDAALEQSGDKAQRFNEDVLCYRAEAEYRLEDYEAAAHTYGLLTDSRPDYPEYHYALSLCYSKMGNIDMALDSYKTALGHEAKDKPAAGRENALTAVTGACIEAERYPEALSLLNSALEDGIKNGRIYNQMGLCQMAQEDYESALNSFDQGYDALATGLNLGTGADLKAILSYEGEAQPDKELLKELAYNRAVSYEYLEQYQKALELFEEYVDAFGPDEKAEHEIVFLKTR